MIVIPGPIKIGGHEYEIKFPHIFRERDGYLGLHDALTRTISISELDFAGCKRPFSEIVRTYFHEVIHAINKTFCAGQIGHDMDEEQLVDAIAEGLTQLYLDNELPYEE